MRWTRTLIPTLKETPSEAEAKSHILMLRAGLIRKLGSGSYSYLPAGFRIIHKITSIVREEMNLAGASELLMPAIWPEKILRESGRLDVFGKDLIRFSDRHGRRGIMAPTHEEAVTMIVRDNLTSFRQLPVTLYQIQTKFRDEVRPRYGILRTREFLMKDAYSFDADQASLEKSYDRMYETYCRIFNRCGLDYVVVEADPGAMGGSRSQEFMVSCDIGDDRFVRCSSCSYAANIENAAAGLCNPPADLGSTPETGPETESTPGARTIEEVSKLLGKKPSMLIKTLLYTSQGMNVAALVRGDHELNENKLSSALGCSEINPASPEIIEKLTDAPVGFAGPVGLSGVRIIADRHVMQLKSCITGANEADKHLSGVMPGKDFEPDIVADIRTASDKDPCPECGTKMSLHHGIEVGHVFQLGTKYSDSLGAVFLDDTGKQRPYVMGCYGIGINRIAAAAAETFSDTSGLVWPPAIAPFKVAVLCLNTDNPQLVKASECAYDILKEAGLDVILDDRDERPGSKFKDADLIGFPVRVIVGKSYEKKEMFELQARKSGEKREVFQSGLAENIQSMLG